jgi:hypothetical protein
MRFFIFILALSALLTCSAAGQISQGDANGDGTIDISDPVYLINYIFSGGDKPAEILLPRIAFEKADTVWKFLDDNQSWFPLLSASITVPDSGLIQITSTVEACAYGAMYGLPDQTAYCQMGLDTIPTAGSMVNYYSTGGGASYFAVISMNHTFACNGGEHTIYLTVHNPAGPSEFRFVNPRLTLVYFPMISVRK